jgi:hypothetical protein
MSTTGKASKLKHSAIRGAGGPVPLNDDVEEPLVPAETPAEAAPERPPPEPRAEAPPPAAQPATA